MFDRKSAARSALRKQDWDSYIWVLHEKPYRLRALLRCITYGLQDDPKLLAQLTRRVWHGSENVWQHPRLWPRLWARIGMSEEDRIALAPLPDPLPIFRGVADPGHWRGLSWTLDRDKAAYFATRFGEDGFVVSGTTNKDDVWAYITERREEEIVVSPKMVRDVRLLRAKNPERNAPGAAENNS